MTQIITIIIHRNKYNKTEHSQLNIKICIIIYYYYY